MRVVPSAKIVGVFSFFFRRRVFICFLFFQSKEIIYLTFLTDLFGINFIFLRILIVCNFFCRFLEIHPKN